jgi:hypothetical protein
MRVACSLQFAAACVCLLAIGLSDRANGAVLGTMPANSIVVLGNSITDSGHNGLGYWGLSASTPEKDYVHLLTSKIDAVTGGSLSRTLTYSSSPEWLYGDPPPDWDANVINIADLFERNFNTWENARIQTQLDMHPDIVVLQFGENMKNGTPQQFQTGLDTLLTGLKNNSNPQIVVTSYVCSEPAGVGAIKQALCAKDPSHRLFVDLTTVFQNPNNIGALGHPSDAGMAVIADTIFDAMVTHSVPEPNSIVLSLIALVGMLAYAWRKRRAAVGGLGVSGLHGST